MSFVREVQIGKVAKYLTGDLIIFPRGFNFIIKEADVVEFAAAGGEGKPFFAVFVPGDAFITGGAAMAS